MRFTLSDKWALSGNSIDEFCKTMKFLSSRTEYKITNTGKWSVLSKGYSVKKGYVVTEISPASIVAFNEANTDAFESRILSYDDFSKVLTEEAMESVGFMIKDDETYFVSRNAVSGIMARAGISGQLYEESFARDVFLADRIHEAGIRFDGVKRDNNCTLIIRTLNGNTPQKKIFAAASEKYKPLPLSVLADVAMHIKNDYHADVKYWQTNHYISEIMFVFPELAVRLKSEYNLKNDILPGVLVRSSDTGSCPFEAIAVAYIGDDYVSLETVSRKHAGTTDMENTIADIFSVVQTAVKKLAGVLKELSCVKCDKKRLSSQYLALSRKIGLTDIVGKKREMIIREKFSSDAETLYDAAISIMTISREEFPETLKRDFAKCCGKVPFLMEKEI